ncbi:hypothetical protein [Peribacillus loiseleuriae]|uniref:hypothetical protein n=1 Tax=Peribacillus loiseleuriae TaxID=1679170 RepID=UPI000670DC88|nr:hypothetical protein [Peribacillus loiseleuriae]
MIVLAVIDGVKNPPAVNTSSSLESKDAEEKAKKKAEALEKKEENAIQKAKEKLIAEEEAASKNIVEVSTIARDKEIADTVKKIIKKEYYNTAITKVVVNDHYGTAKDNDYIVLPYLKWDSKNTKKTTKEILKLYSEDLAAQLIAESDISEITVFWEVPYHLEGANIAKFNYSRSGKNMAIDDVWYDPSIRKRIKPSHIEKGSS